MIHKFNNKKLKILLLFFTIFGFCFTLQTYGQEQNSNINIPPNVHMISLDAEIKDGKIIGSFSGDNNTSYYINNLNYEISLFQGTEFGKLKLVDSYIEKEPFFVAPGQVINKFFTYEFPKNIISGDYTLRVQTITETGNYLGWIDKIIFLEGENKFLEILSEYSKILVDEKEYLPGEGAVVKMEGENAFMRIRIKNLGEKIDVIPNIKVFQRQVNMPLIKEYKDSIISFDKGETKNIDLKIPKMDESESYLAEVMFLDNNENKQISGIQRFRWVVEGIGGKILNIKIDKDYFKKGEILNFTVESIGPGDLFNENLDREGLLNIIITEQDDTIIEKVSKEVSLNSQVILSEISIPIKKDLIAPKIYVNLMTKNQNILLDESVISIPVFSEQAKQIQKNRMMHPIYILIALIILIVIFVFGLLVYKYRFKFKKI